MAEFWTDVILIGPTTYAIAWRYSMRKRNIILLSAIVVLLAATTVGMTCEKSEKAEGEKQGWAKENPEKAAEIKALAIKAEGGCEHSTKALIAMVKESGCEKGSELATKAEGGCKKSTQELITMAKGMGECKCGGKCDGKCKGEHKAGEHDAEKEGCKEHDIKTLAAHAEGGCPKAKAGLIAHAKEHGCEETKALAAKAEGGCEKSMQKLVAMAKEEKKAE